MSNITVADLKAAIVAARWSHGSEIVGERAAGILVVDILAALPQTLRHTEVAAVLEAYTDEGVRAWLTSWVLATPEQRRPMETGVVVEWSGEWPAPIPSSIPPEPAARPGIGEHVKVHELTPGDRVGIAGFTEATFVGQTDHPLYKGLRLVTWRMADGSWSHDALDPRQDVGVLIGGGDRTERLRAALGGA